MAAANSKYDYADDGSLANVQMLHADFLNSLAHSKVLGNFASLPMFSLLSFDLETMAMRQGTQIITMKNISTVNLDSFLPCIEKKTTFITAPVKRIT